jgi:hypothetical protein
MKTADGVKRVDFSDKRICRLKGGPGAWFWIICHRAGRQMIIDMIGMAGQGRFWQFRQTNVFPHRDKIAAAEKYSVYNMFIQIFIHIHCSVLSSSE